MDRKISKANKTGITGVFHFKGKWKASIGVGDKRIHLGTFETPELAAAAYSEAAAKYRPNGRQQPKSNAKTVPVLLDAEDEHLREKYLWCSSGHGYAKAWDGETKKFVYLHRLVMNAPKGLVVDHINRDRADCRRANLRLANRAGNALNAKKKKCRAAHGKYSRHVGVAWNDGCKRWVATYRGKYLGVFVDEDSAALAYNAAALADNNEFARFNTLEKAA